MPSYRRNHVPGGTFFFTVVVHQRYSLFQSALARRLLRKAIQTVERTAPFDLFAICLLPDHLHTIWILPPGDADYSKRWQHIKDEFTRPWIEQGDWDNTKSIGAEPTRARVGMNPSIGASERIGACEEDGGLASLTLLTHPTAK